MSIVIEELIAAREGIENAFIWGATPEGEDYWCEVHDKLVRMVEEYERPEPTKPEDPFDRLEQLIDKLSDTINLL